VALNTKFDELLDFPCSLSFKVMGVADPQLVPDVISVIQTCSFYFIRQYNDRNPKQTRYPLLRDTTVPKSMARHE